MTVVVVVAMGVRAITVMWVVVVARVLAVAMLVVMTMVKTIVTVGNTADNVANSDSHDIFADCLIQENRNQ